MMSSFNVILHPTDFSDDADQAFQVACNIANDQCSKIIVLHVIPPWPAAHVEAVTGALDDDQPEISNCHNQFQRLKSIADDIPLTLRIERGYPVGVILEVACQEGADIIVVASHRHSQFHLQIHGSVAEGILRKAPCPVLCLRDPNPGTRNVAGNTNRDFDK